MITIYKAESIGREVVPELHINATEAAPEMRDLVAAHAHYQEQARAIADALSTSLPGGTVHELLVELLQRKACLLRVPA